MFSRLAHYLNTHDAYDRDGILDAILNGYRADTDKMDPVVANLDRAANISDWIAPHLAPTPNLTQFRQFKIEKGIDGTVTVCARRNCADNEFSGRI